MSAMAEDGKNGIEQVGWTPEVEELLCDWRRRVYAAQAAYYGEAERLRRRNYQLGIPVVIVSSLVGTAIFGNWADDQTYKWWVGGVSILAAVLASLQTFLKFGESATLHGAAADWFAAIRRDIEEMLALPLNLRGKPKECLDSIRQEMNKAGQKAPELSERLWQKVARRFAVEEPPCAGGRPGSRAAEIIGASARGRNGRGKWSTRLRQGFALSTGTGEAGRPATDATAGPSRDRHPLTGHARHE
jgi:hypothetical protein